MTLVWVALGAAIGAPARYLTDRAVQGRHDSVFPWGTLTVNMVGSFVLGLLTAAATHVAPAVAAAAGTGFCGALTTFSTFQVETIRLAKDGYAVTAAGYAGASIAAGVAVAVAATVVARRRRYG
jgi:fluoride exporter